MSDLNLFKYDPSTDGEQTFNIDKALNQNWDKIETKSQEVDKNIEWLQRDVLNVDAAVTNIREEVNNMDVSWNGITGKPGTFPPSSHTHDYLPLGGGSVSGYLGVGGNMDINGNVGIGGQFYLNVDGSAVGINTLLSELKTKVAGQNGYIIPSNNWRINNKIALSQQQGVSGAYCKNFTFYVPHGGGVRVDLAAKRTGGTLAASNTYHYISPQIFMLSDGGVNNKTYGYGNFDHINTPNNTVVSRSPHGDWLDVLSLPNIEIGTLAVGSTNAITYYLYLRPGLYVMYSFTAANGSGTSFDAEFTWKIGYSEVNV